jgi:hypothetical protein
MPNKNPVNLNFAVLLKLTALACVLLFAARTSCGFCLQPDPTVRCEFLNSDAVFVGTVILEHTSTQEGDPIDGWIYRLTVHELFRGPRTKTIEVYTGNDSARFPLKVGKEYLIFASIFEGQFEITSCGNSALLPKAAKAIGELRKLKIAEDAEIEGRFSNGIPDSGLHRSGIVVNILGGGRTFRTVSDRNGRFHLHVPPGIYSAEAQPIPGWTIISYDLNYDDPQHFEARKGHCSGLQFLTTRTVRP